MSTFYTEILETATRLNLEIGNHYSDLYVEFHPEILEIAVKYGKAKRNTFSNAQLSRGIHTVSYSGLKRFTCLITGKPMIEFAFAYSPYWEAKQAESERRQALTLES